MNTASRETGCTCALYKAAGKMAALSVVEAVKVLCGQVLDQALRPAHEGDVLLSSLQPPSKMGSWSQHKRQRMTRKLAGVTFDLLLLQKWA